MMPSMSQCTAFRAPYTADSRINLIHAFFRYQPLRPLCEIDAELAGVEQRILELLREVTE